MNNEEKNIEKNEEKIGIMSIVFVLIGVICIGAAGFGLYGIYKDYKVGTDIYNQAEEEFVQIHTPVVEPDKDVEPDESETMGTESEETEGTNGPWYEMATVDVEGLQNRYPDVVGWLFFEDGLISYPIMHSFSNNTYLYTAYNGTESIGGSIFVEATNSGDFSDTHTIIYGHNMKNLSMFGRLKYYRWDNGYYNDHQYFQVFRNNEILRYRIFAYQEVSVESFVYSGNFASAKEWGNNLLKNSIVKPDVAIPQDGKIVTLSTCTGDDDHRFVVSAVLVERYSLLEK